MSSGLPVLDRTPVGALFVGLDRPLRQDRPGRGSPPPTRSARSMSTKTSPKAPSDDGGRTRDAVRDLARTKTGTFVPKRSLEAGYKAAARLERIWRKRILYTLGALALMLLGYTMVMMAQKNARGSKIETVLRDAGYVVAKRKGIGINR